MSKYIKLDPAASLHGTGFKQYQKTTKRASAKTILLRLLMVVVFLAVMSMTVLAFYSNIVLFQYLLTSLFIIGCVLLIKGVSDEKTTIEKIRKNTNQ